MVPSSKKSVYPMVIGSCLPVVVRLYLLSGSVKHSIGLQRKIESLFNRVRIVVSGLKITILFGVSSDQTTRDKGLTLHPKSL